MSNIVPFRPRGKQLSTFIDAVLEPLPPHVMLDTAHNRELRRAAYDAFIVAQRKYDYYHALRKARDAAEPLRWYPVEKQMFPLLVEWPDATVIVDQYRAALMDCLLTLTPETAHIEWKKRRLKPGYLHPDDKAAVEAAIARDEAFKAAHPVQRKGETS